MLKTLFPRLQANFVSDAIRLKENFKRVLIILPRRENKVLMDRQLIVLSVNDEDELLLCVPVMCSIARPT